jgi:hypothetical protein
MRYRDSSELADIQAAIDAIHSDLQRTDRGPRARAPLVP